MNKRGSYIVEASIVLPILILCICSLITIVRIISVCENITFATSKHLTETVVSYYNNYNEISLCMEIRDDIKEVSDFRITQFRYLYKDKSNDGLIKLKAEADFKVNSPIGINNNILFQEQILCRGFIGSAQNEKPLSEYEFNDYKEACMVYVFPKYGKRFHDSNCRYIKYNSGEGAYIIYMDREDAYRKGFTPCIVCKGAAYE